MSEWDGMPSELMCGYINMVHKFGFVKAHDWIHKQIGHAEAIDFEVEALKQGHVLRTTDGQIVVNYDKWDAIDHE